MSERKASNMEGCEEYILAWLLIIGSKHRNHEDILISPSILILNSLVNHAIA
jgi:hypothetical protein